MLRKYVPHEIDQSVLKVIYTKCFMFKITCQMSEFRQMQIKNTY